MGTKQGDPNSATELAIVRTREAADRTPLAWIRTSLALIGFGFTADKILSVLQAGKSASPLHSALVFTLSFIALGTQPGMRSNREETCHPLAADFPGHSRYTEKCWMQSGGLWGRSCSSRARPYGPAVGRQGGVQVAATQSCRHRVPRDAGSGALPHH